MRVLRADPRSRTNVRESVIVLGPTRLPQAEIWDERGPNDQVRNVEGDRDGATPGSGTDLGLPPGFNPTRARPSVGRYTRTRNWTYLARRAGGGGVGRRDSSTCDAGRDRRRIAGRG